MYVCVCVCVCMNVINSALFLYLTVESADRTSN